MGVPPFMIAGALNTVVAQRLARKICQKCKTEDTEVTQAQLKDIGFNITETETVTVYKGKVAQIVKKQVIKEDKVFMKYWK